MGLTERERLILEIELQGLTDYRIARKLKLNPPNVTRSRKNAHKKLLTAIRDIQWVTEREIRISGYAENLEKKSSSTFRFFL